MTDNDQQIFLTNQSASEEVMTVSQYHIGLINTLLLNQQIEKIDQTNTWNIFYCLIAAIENKQIPVLYDELKAAPIIIEEYEPVSQPIKL